MGPSLKLLVIPLLIYQFERWPYGNWVFAAFLASCALLMVYSFAVAVDPDLSLKLYLSRGPYKVESGIAVRNYIDQSQEFGLCAIALVYPIVTLFREGRVRIAMLLAVLLLGFLAQHDFRRGLAHGAGDAADPGRGVCAAASALAHGFCWP